MERLREQRYQGLDHLRGMLATLVMIYHCLLWLEVSESAPLILRGPLQLIGLYAVSTFYALSGAALFLVYRNRAVDRPFLREFVIKRAFRIIPLFWAATTATMVYRGFAPLRENPLEVMLSYSMLFSWVNPKAYFAVGAWSIGNEWAF